MTLAVNIAQSGANNVSFRNRIINGAMVIDQRNAGASMTATAVSTYTLDRWTANNNIASKYTVQQNAGAVTPPAGFTNYLGVTSLAATTVAAGNYYQLIQNIEGFNCSDLNFGTANAQTITLSFWVRSSLTGTFGGSLNNSAESRSYPYSYTISSANTWEYKTIVIAGDTTGTWLTNNGVGLAVRFSLGMGSTYSGPAGAWASALYASATGATSVVGTSGATFYITGVQLEAGTAASPFEYRQYGTELALCQRYYTTIAAATQYPTGYTFSTNRVLCSYFFPATMRAAPTAATSSTFAYFQNGGVATSSAATFSTTLSGSVMLDITVTATANTSGSIANNAAVTLSSEL